MNVVYPTGSCNVGDELNGWMWNTLLADFHDPDTALLGVGTLLRLLDWSRLCAESGLTFVSPLLPADLFMKQLCSADLVLSEAMHDAILADIVRVPWRAFSFGRHFNTEKWRDWGDAFDLRLELVRLHGFYDPSFYLSDRSTLKHLALGAKAFASRGSIGKKKWTSVTPPGWPLGKAMNGAVRALRSLAAMEGQLSDIAIYQGRVAMLYERLDSLRRDHGLVVGGVMSGDPLRYLSKGVVQ